MRPLLCMQSVIYWNVIMWHMTIIIFVVLNFWCDVSSLDFYFYWFALSVSMWLSQLGKVFSTNLSFLLLCQSVYMLTAHSLFLSIIALQFLCYVLSHCILDTFIITITSINFEYLLNDLYIFWLNLHENPKKWALLPFLIYTQGNWGQIRLNNFPKFMWLGSDTVTILTQAGWLWIVDLIVINIPLHTVCPR